MTDGEHPLFCFLFQLLLCTLCGGSQDIFSTLQGRGNSTVTYDWNFWVEAGVWCLAILLLIFACLKNWRKAIVGFLFIQLLTWPFGIIPVEYGALEYPVRFFPKIIKTSFTYEFLALPAVGSIYCIYFPVGHRKLVKAIYIVTFPTVLTIGEVIILIYTDLIRYLHWNWFITWVTVTIILHLNYLYFKWFFKRQV